MQTIETATLRYDISDPRPYRVEVESAKKTAYGWTKFGSGYTLYRFHTSGERDAFLCEEKNLDLVIFSSNGKQLPNYRFNIIVNA